MPPIAPPIRVLVAAAPDLSDRLCRACGADPGLALVAATDDLTTALRLIELHAPDIVLADLTLLGTGERVDELALLTGRPDVRVITVARAPHAGEVLEALRRGARGDILPDESPATVAAAVRAVHRGEVRLSAPVTARLFAELRRMKRADDEAR
ncbi:MAG: hypothetical protein U0470_03665 [Anaerolineae bacterium]